MEKLVKVEGMSCMHCENRVKNALEAIDADILEISADKDLVRVNISSEDELKEVVEAIEDAGYDVV
ncbi:MAG: heavy-metal-associated domain-containing protein [Tissierellales bacterium]|jgi:copper chaperone CopZ|nr:heavy-metal-associated domain-containing protein [Tissierellales bacterium]